MMMKAKYMFLAASLAALLSACTRWTDDEGKDIDTDGYTVFKVDMEAVDILPGESLGGVWKDGDRIGVFGNESGQNVPYCLKKTSVGKADAVFYGPKVSGSSVDAYFPYDGSAARVEEGLLCELEKVQLYEPETALAEHFLKYCPRMFAVLGLDGTLGFRYPMGLLKVCFDIEEELPIVSLAIVSKKGISGRLAVSDGTEVSPLGISATSIELDFGGRMVASRDASGACPFWFVLPPAQYAAGELVLEVKTCDEAMKVSLGEIQVSRVEGNDFSVKATEVTLSELPGFTRIEGYHE